MTVVCINDKDKPNEIPNNKWIVEGNIYTVVKIKRLLSYNQVGYELEEIELNHETFPYFYFNTKRFKLCQDDLSMNKLLEEVKEIIKEKKQVLDEPRNNKQTTLSKQKP